MYWSHKLDFIQVRCIPSFCHKTSPRALVQHAQLDNTVLGCHTPTTHYYTNKAKSRVSDGLCWWYWSHTFVSSREDRKPQLGKMQLFVKGVWTTAFCVNCVGETISFDILLASMLNFYKWLDRLLEDQTFTELDYSRSFNDCASYYFYAAIGAKFFWKCVFVQN